MPFTTSILATYMATQLGATGIALFGATPATHAAIVDAVAEVEAVLDAAVADLTDDLKTRTVARWIAWRTALGAASSSVDLKAGAAQIWQNQRFTNIRAMLADAEAAALRYEEVQEALSGAGGTAYVTGITTGGNPYSWPASDEWASG